MMKKSENGNVSELDSLRLRLSLLEKSGKGLALENERIKALLEISDMCGSSSKDIITAALEKGMALVGSPTGFLAWVREDGSGLVGHIASGRLPATVPDIERLPIWSDLLKTRNELIINEPESLTMKWPGDVKLTRLLGVPVIEGDRVVALCAVADKASAYDEADAMQLSLFLNSAWPIMGRKISDSKVAEIKSRLEMYLDLMCCDISYMDGTVMAYIEFVIERLGSGDLSDDVLAEVLKKAKGPLEYNIRVTRNVLDRMKELETSTRI